VVGEIIYTRKFERAMRKIRDASVAHRVKTQIEEIISRPDIGKPLAHDMKGERSCWVPPFRIVYSYFQNRLIFLNFRNRDDVYSH